MFLERWLNPTPKQGITPAAWLWQKAAECGFASNIIKWENCTLNEIGYHLVFSPVPGSCFVFHQPPIVVTKGV